MASKLHPIGLPNRSQVITSVNPSSLPSTARSSWIARPLQSNRYPPLLGRSYSSPLNLVLRSSPLIIIDPSTFTISHHHHYYYYSLTPTPSLLRSFIPPQNSVYTYIHQPLIRPSHDSSAWPGHTHQRHTSNNQSSFFDPRGRVQGSHRSQSIESFAPARALLRGPPRELRRWWPHTTRSDSTPPLKRPRSSLGHPQRRS